MKAKHFILLSLAIYSLSSCEKNEVPNPPLENSDYLIFGHYYGLCAGPTCVAMFKLTDSELFEDTNDNYGGGNFSFVQLSNADFLLVEDLEQSIPSQLETMPAQTFGVPDSYDQGGIYVELKSDSTTTVWRIDQDKNAVPSYLHSFMDDINGKIGLLLQ